MSQERIVKPVSGSVGLTVTILLTIIGIFLINQAVHSNAPLGFIVLAVLSLAVAGLGPRGLFTAQPNESVVLVLFGSYVGTVRESGWGWTNPFIPRPKLSLRARSLNGEKIKGNDN